VFFRFWEGRREGFDVSGDGLVLGSFPWGVEDERGGGQSRNIGVLMEIYGHFFQN
jgi:hypothetical protein